MRKVKMINSTNGSPDGMRVLIYQKNYEYVLPDKLAKAFVEEMQAAEYVDGGSGRKRKAMPAAPENAAINAAPENAAASELDEKPVMRVYQLAEKLDVATGYIIKVARKLGIKATAPASGLSDDHVKLITKEIRSKSKK